MFDHSLKATELILIQELKGEIERMKADGQEYPAIKERCIDWAKGSWCVTGSLEQERCVAVALYAYALTEEQKEAQQTLKEATGLTLF